MSKRVESNPEEECTRQMSQACDFSPGENYLRNGEELVRQDGVNNGRIDKVREVRLQGRGVEGQVL